MPQPRQSPNYWTVISVTAMSKCNKIVPGELYKNVRVVSTVRLFLSTWRLQLPTAKLLRAPIIIVYIRKLPGFLHHSFQTKKTPSKHLPNVCIPSRYQHSEDQLGPLGPSAVWSKRGHTASVTIPQWLLFSLLPKICFLSLAISRVPYNSYCCGYQPIFRSLWYSGCGFLGYKSLVFSTFPLCCSRSSSSVPGFSALFSSINSPTFLVGNRQQGIEVSGNSATISHSPPSFLFFFPPPHQASLGCQGFLNINFNFFC